MRNELLHIGEELVAIGLGTAPIDVERVGKLLHQLAIAYGKLNTPPPAPRPVPQKRKGGRHER